MIYLKLFLSFLYVGCFSFGGYAAVPLVRDTVLSNNWMNESKFADLIAISESTPGPIMVNMATFTGNEQGGVLGAAVATIAVVLPAFIIILALMKLMQKAIKKPAVQAAVDGIKPAVVGVILATGIYMLLKSLIRNFPGTDVDIKALGLAAVLALIYFGSKKILKNGISPIILIVISGVAGVLLYAI